MENLSPFCTCTDTKCPNHPTNHERGCSLCMAKCLKAHEVPSCLFKEADPDYKGPGYTIEDFAQLVAEQKNGK